MPKRIYYYGVKDQELLNDNPKDAYMAYIENSILNNKSIEHPVRILQFEPKIIVLDSDDILEDILIMLDENYGDPDEDLTTPTIKMKEAAKQFAQIIEEEYVSWLCEPNGMVYEYHDENTIDMYSIKHKQIKGQQK